MNLNEERNYQKLMNTLEALELTGKNRELAESYLNMEQPEQKELLDQAERQDYSKLTQEKQRKSTDYIEHCKKRNRTEELGRYVRFLAATGGSTAHYVLVQYGWNLNSILEYLTREQSAAIRAEGMVWNQYRLSYQCIKELFSLEAQNPGVLKRAMDLCWHQYDNAKVLLAAVYLHGRKAAGEKTGLFQGLMTKSASARNADDAKVTAFLEENLTDSLPSVFLAPKPSESELKQLQIFVKNSDPDTPFPQQFFNILSGRQVSEYLITLLAGSAFLALEHSKRFTAFLRLAAALNPEYTLNACKNMSGNPWFQNHIKTLEKLLPVKPDTLIGWYLNSRVPEGLTRMASQYPGEVETAAEKATTEEYQFLLEQVKKGNSKLYQKMNASYSGGYQRKLASELTEDMTNGQAEARQYLLGETSLDTLYPFVNSWRGGYNYNYRRFQKLQQLKKSGGQLYCRGVVLEALRMMGGFFTNSFSTLGRGVSITSSRASKLDVEGIVKLFEEERMPIRYQADALEGIYGSYYSDADKAIVMDKAVECLSARYRDHVPEFHESIRTSTAIGRGISIRVLDNYWQEEKDTILSCAMDSSKQVKEVLWAVCSAHREWEPEMLAFLSSKKSQERELAIRVLKIWGIENYQTELAKALETEKSKKLKELLQSCLGVKAEQGGEASPQTLDELAKEILKGGKKRKVAWAYETPFSEVHKKDGSPAEEDYMQALLTAYTDMSVPGVSSEAARLAAELEERELNRYVSELFDKWMEAGAEAKKKWVLYAASIHGGEEIVPVFWRQIQDWPQHARGALAAEAVKALALNGSSQALLQVDQISRKFKFRQVKTAAAQALEYAASSLGISRAELEDRIVPSLGFDERMERTFDYGTRTFRVYLTPALELEIFDADEKRLKNIPAPGKRDEEEKAAAAYAEFKQLKKQLKTVTANQKLRLEQALTAERLWNAEQWKELFVKNPVMHQFAIGLIWGIYESGSLKETFRYMEDGSFNTKDEEEMELPEAGTIGLVHPIELSGEDLAAWKEQLSDYEIVQPIEQLERAVYRLTEEEKGQGELVRFGGKLLNGLSLSGKLQGMGWYRGSVQDAGVYTTFYREDGELGVELEFSGSYVGDENDEVTVYGAAFYKAGTVKRGSYVYDTIKAENRYTLDKVSPRYFSEIVLQLTRATASSQEQLAYPECKK